MVCPKCGKTYKRAGAFEKHVASCEGTATVDARKEPRVKMTEEEKAIKRKEYLETWLAKQVTTTIRIDESSDEAQWIEAAVEELQNDYESAGRATVLRLLIFDAIARDVDISELGAQYLAEEEQDEEA